MQRQYREFREKLPADALLLFRLGDFYELFGSDAETASRLLGITLTKRHDQPMAGIPHHAAPAYVQKLLAAGLKVAICDQVESPVPGKLVRRALSRILTPGTALEDSQLDSRRGNYLLALAQDRSGWHAAWLDVSTADFRLATEPDLARLLPALHALAPAEVLLAEGFEPPEDVLALAGAGRVSRTPGWNFDVATGARLVAETLGVHGLAGFGIAEDHPALGAAGAAVAYVTDSLCDRPRNLRRLSEFRLGQSVLLDPASSRNLELFATQSGQRAGSLLEAVDRTRTPAGARLLARWLAEPTTDLAVVAGRSGAVEALVRHPGAAARLGTALEGVRDLPRILSRLQNRLRNPRELGGGVRLALAQYRELAAFAQFASDLDEATRKQLERGRLVTELMKQPQYAPMSISDMAVTLYAADKGYFDDVEVKRALECEKSMISYLKANCADVMNTMESTADLSADTEKALAAGIQAFKSTWA